MKQLQSIELFSGAGGLSLGLHEAGFKHLALYEWNPAAVDTLIYNQKIGYHSLQGCEIHRADVRDVDFKRFKGIDLVAERFHHMFSQVFRAVTKIQTLVFV